MTTASAEKRTRRMQRAAEVDGGSATPPTTIGGKKRATDTDSGWATGLEVSKKSAAEASAVRVVNGESPAPPNTRGKKRATETASAAGVVNGVSPAPPNTREKNRATETASAVGVVNGVSPAPPNTRGKNRATETASAVGVVNGVSPAPPNTRGKYRATETASAAGLVNGVSPAPPNTRGKNRVTETASTVGVVNGVSPAPPNTRGKNRATETDSGRATGLEVSKKSAAEASAVGVVNGVSPATPNTRGKKRAIETASTVGVVNGVSPAPPNTRGKKRATETDSGRAMGLEVSKKSATEASAVGGVNVVSSASPNTRGKKRVTNTNGPAKDAAGVKKRTKETSLVVGGSNGVALAALVPDQSVEDEDLDNDGYYVGSDLGSQQAEKHEMEEKGQNEVMSIKISPKKKVGHSKKSKEGAVLGCHFVGDPIPEAEAKQRWPERYQRKIYASGSAKRVDGESVLLARQHYSQAIVDGVNYNLYDDAYVEAGEGEAYYIGRIVEFFEAIDKQQYFTAQWFFRAEDTVIKEHAHSHGSKVMHDSRRVFLSEEKNDNVLECIVSKLQIQRVTPNINLQAKVKSIPPCDLYYDMSYSLAYSTFTNLPGCGAMSTGLCLGANLSGINLQTCWAVDLNEYACQSLKLNHPETEVRNEKADDFLALLIEWEKLCTNYCVFGNKSLNEEESDSNGSDDELDSNPPNGEEFEVEKLVGICYGDPNNIGKVGIKFKVHWKGYNSSHDTWEPIDGLSNCQERIMEFVKKGYKKNILPLPGQVDVICGGPPCQGISGFNRFRNKNAPLDDPKNQQMLVFMDIVEFLKPKYVLMENVVDILKFANGFLGRYALSRLVAMNYQARLGMMVAGCYGLPQFRMRVFLWGARPTEILPQFPLPTHDVVVRGGAPNEFEQNIVAYDEDQHPQLEKKLLLEDAISDLPEIGNYEDRDEMPHDRPPITEFQKFIRLSRIDLCGCAQALASGSIVDRPIAKHQFFDHRPLQLNDDDYQRVCAIPKKKGANFRDLPGVKVGKDNTVEWDPDVERVFLPSGKPLVPDYAMTFVRGKSSKPFGRLWWDETVPTVVTRAEPHNQVILHPEQDRVLSIRENARLQGFPDYYQLRGTVKERYTQVGNAVAVPVARALGYALGQAYQGHSNGVPLFALPRHFLLQ
ncbi:DNA (cytosine-5)-methyltransferase 1-like isoform X2 [Zingiber officinale]|uniref:DNA (cytosine-5)-methyltransferase 1-like isoform X2 n=1 Tax=Zingiber officinale TaxID=94328 RepID=UPI001C4A7690|nr:DNA (cytosine-5)-methyltransferase 1-like isoform X2 [Zingiber officinale]